MLRGAPPAAGPTGTVGRARATPQLHGAVRSGTVGRGPWAQPGPPAVDGPRRLRVDACASRHRRPRDQSCQFLGIAGRTRAGGAARLGVDLHVTLHVYARPPWHRRPRDPQGDRGLRAGRRSCVTRAAGRPVIDPGANGFISTGVASPSGRDAPGENPAAAPCGRRA